MPAKLSKEVTDRFRAALFVLSAFRFEGPRVAANLLTLIRPELLEGDEEPGSIGPPTEAGPMLDLPNPLGHVEDGVDRTLDRAPDVGGDVDHGLEVLAVQARASTRGASRSSSTEGW
jgi:hypothetical protein